MATTMIAPVAGRSVPAAVSRLNNINWVDMLVHAYPNANVTAATLALLAAMFADTDAAVMRAAALAHIEGSRWFPTVAELREAAVVARRRLDEAEQQQERAAELAQLLELYRLRHEALEAAYAGIEADLESVAQAFADKGRGMAAFALRLKAARLSGGGA